MDDIYCPNCDRSFDQMELKIIPDGQWYEHLACPYCDDKSECMLSDNFFMIADYLLSVADDDFVYSLPLMLPSYEA